MAANDYSHLRTKTADHSITTDYTKIMEEFRNEDNWFLRAQDKWTEVELPWDAHDNHSR